MKVSRRRFSKATATEAVIIITAEALGLQGSQLGPDIKNPLQYYSNRDWGKIHRDQFRYDSSLTSLCALNDLRQEVDSRTSLRNDWAPSEAIVNLARQIAANKASTLLSHGMGPNHFFVPDLKDHARLLVAALSILATSPAMPTATPTITESRSSSGP